MKYRLTIISTTFVFLGCLNLIAHAQDDFPFVCAQGNFSDSTLVIDNDSVTIISGVNSSLGVRFWSQDLFEGGESEKLSDTTSLSYLCHIGHVNAFFDGYLHTARDTANWKSFQDSSFGISFRHPPQLRVRYETQVTDQHPLMELGMSTVSATNREDSFTVCIRMYFTDRRFSQEVSSRGWDTTHAGFWFLSQEDWAGLAYLRGIDWECLCADRQFFGGDAPKFLAMIDRHPQESLVVELLDQLFDGDVDNVIWDEEFYQLLSSIHFRSK